MAESKRGKTSSPSPLTTFPRHLGTPRSTALLLHFSTANLLYLIPGRRSESELQQSSQLYAVQVKNSGEARRFLGFSSALSGFRLAQPHEEGSGGGANVAKKEVRDFEWSIDELKMQVDSNKEAVNVKDDSDLIEEFGNKAIEKLAPPFRYFEQIRTRRFKR